MLQQQRLNDFQDSLRLAFNGLMRSAWFAMPCIVESYNAAEGTVQVSPAIKAVVTNSDGTETPTAIQDLVDVPVVFMGGGGAVTTYPISKGDEALVIFADRCIDYWFALGGVQRPAESRAHSLSDGFAIIGPRSLARALVNVSTTTAQFRSLDGTTYFEIGPTGVANVVAPGGLTVDTSAADFATLEDATIGGNLHVGSGASGTFSTGTGQTVTVRDGIIISIE